MPGSARSTAPACAPAAAHRDARVPPRTASAGFGEPAAQLDLDAEPGRLDELERLDRTRLAQVAARELDPTEVRTGRVDHDPGRGHLERDLRQRLLLAHLAQDRCGDREDLRVAVVGTRELLGRRPGVPVDR